MCLFRIFCQRLSLLCFAFDCFLFLNILIRMRRQSFSSVYIFWGPKRWFAQSYETNTATWGFRHPVQRALNIFSSLCLSGVCLFPCVTLSCLLSFIEKNNTPLHSIPFLLKTCFFREFRVSVAIQIEGWLCLRQYFSNLDTVPFNGRKFLTDIRGFLLIILITL